MLMETRFTPSVIPPLTRMSYFSYQQNSKNWGRRIRTCLHSSASCEQVWKATFKRVSKNENRAQITHDFYNFLKRHPNEVKKFNSST